MEKIEAMPMIMIGRYIPKACKTLDSRRAFIEEHRTRSRPIRKGVQPARPGLADFRLAKDTQNRLWFYVVDTVKSDLIYLMHLNPLRIKIASASEVDSRITKFAMYQGSVWRANSWRELSILGDTFAKRVFWGLFNQRRNLFSDSIQSEGGKRFWMNRLGEAAQKGLAVFAVHFKDEGGVLVVDKTVSLDEYEQLNPDDYYTYEYDEDYSGAYWRFAICHP